MKGRVVIVGAGPGDPELITLKGLKALKGADVIVYDRLVSPELLREARPGCELIYAGKAPGRHTLTQDEINRLLVEKALEGKTVVRLKGGDPYLYGRGEEECMYVAQHGIECVVIPGVTSAIAVPAYAGIPVTNRGLASTVAIATGMEAREKKRRAVDYAKLAEATDTLVILMGVSRLEEIVEEVRRVRGSEEPVAIIVNGTTEEQRVVVGTLGDIVEKARRARVESPAVIVVGKTVTLREKLWRLS